LLHTVEKTTGAAMVFFALAHTAFGKNVLGNAGAAPALPACCMHCHLWALILYLPV